MTTCRICQGERSLSTRDLLSIAKGVVEDLAAVGVVAQSIVDPHAVGLVVHVCDPCIEIAIAIEVAEADIAALGIAVCVVGKEREGAVVILAIDQSIPIVIDAVGTDLCGLGVAGCGNRQVKEGCPEEKPHSEMGCSEMGCRRGI